jgi:diguanylate cyclase (GGDEF)-like protein
MVLLLYHESWARVTMSETEEVIKAINCMPEGMMLIGRDQKILFINEAASKILNETVPPVTHFQKVVEKIGFDPLRLLEESGNAQCTRETSIANVPYKLTVFPVPNGDALKVVSILLRNISQEKKIDTMKSDFISMVSHEMRTPLTSIKNALEIVMSKRTGEITGEQEKFLQIADRNVNRVVNIISNYLDLAKIELGKIEFQFRNIHLPEVVKTIMNDFTRRAREKGVTLTCDIPADLPEITADPQRLEQIFINLVDNALKFTPEGGRVSISARLETGSAASSQGTKIVKVSVEDTGRGIPENEAERIFDKFYQVEDPLLKTKGTGLGLSIVKELIEAHGGKIEVESKPGMGSKFSFYLREAAGEKRDLQFRYFFNREFIRASKNQCNLSLVTVLIKNFSEIRDIFGQEKVNLLLEALQKVLKGMVLRQADIVIHYKQGEIFVVLCENEKRGAEIIKSRIKNQIREFSGDSLKQILKKSVIGVGVATYPEEASSQRELFQKAIQNAEEDLI